ncbi:hypothetical protein BKA64DRAFT_643381 [Cadophora sp. MPI-SDFR-AT-0126]|nr:hypothetical protein BKA64DRAFT_643381 [Leotiomycetes sp. MPI-SDFR-AT-0126]
MNSNTPARHPPLPDSPPFAAGEPGDVKSMSFQSSSGNRNSYLHEAPANVQMAFNVNVTKNAPDFESAQAAEAVFPTQPLVVNGSKGKREPPTAMGRQRILSLPENNVDSLSNHPPFNAPVAPDMVRTGGFYGFPTGNQQHYPSHERPAMQYQHANSQAAAAQSLSDSGINNQLLQDLTALQRQLREAQHDNHQLRGQIEVMNHGMQIAATEKEGFSRSIRQMTASIEILGAANGEMTEQIKELSNKTRNFSSSIEQKDAVIEDLSNANRVKEDKLENLSAQNENLHISVSQQHTLIDKQCLRNRQQERQIEHLKAVNTDLQKKSDRSYLRACWAEDLNRALQNSHTLATNFRHESMQKAWERNDLLKKRWEKIKELMSRLDAEIEEHERDVEFANDVMERQSDEIDELEERNGDLTAALDITMQGAKEESDKHNLRERELETEIQSLKAELHDKSTALDAATRQNRDKEQELEEILMKSNKKTKENESRSKRQARLNVTELNVKLSKELEIEKEKSRAAAREKIEWQEKFLEVNARETTTWKGSYLRNMGAFFVLVVLFFHGLQASAQA